MLQSLEAQPDQTAVELLIEFRARYPELYSLRQLCTLERRVRVWRREAVQRLMCQMKNLTQDCTAIAYHYRSSLNRSELLPPMASDAPSACGSQSNRKETRERPR
jgi:hypothetical protein